MLWPAYWSQLRLCIKPPLWQQLCHKVQALMCCHSAGMRQKRLCKQVTALSSCYHFSDLLDQSFWVYWDCNSSIELCQSSTFLHRLRSKVRIVSSPTACWCFATEIRLELNNMRATALAAGVITHSLLLYHPGILEGRAVTATAYRDADGMVLAAYGPSDLQVVCRTDGSHTAS